MGIFLGILKVIGIILLCILGLILLLILLTLFSPLTYNVYASGSKEKVKAVVKLGWFLYIIRPIITFEDNELTLKVRLFGIPINLSGGRKKPEKKRPEEKALPAETEPVVVSEPEEVSEVTEASLPEAVSEEVTVVVEAEAETVEEAALIEVKEEINEVKEEAPAEKRGFLHKIKDKLKKGKKKPKLTEEEKQRLKEEQERLKAEKKEEKKRKREETKRKAEEGIAKAKEIWAFLQEDETKEAIALVKDVIRKTVKHIMPGHFKGHVNLGFEDPSNTGVLVGLVAAAYPVHRGNVVVSPFFDTEKTVLDGEVRFGGHVFVIFFVVQGLRILRNKRIMSLVKSARSGGLK